jgi:hypothetical protein
MATTRRGFLAGATATGITAGASPAAAAVHAAAVRTPRLVGRVIDDAARPVANARIIRLGQVVAEAGMDGSFSVTLNGKDRDALTFVHEDYVPNTRVYFGRRPAAGNVVLWPVAHKVRFDAARDFSATLDGAEIRIPADALITAGGRPVAGSVVLSFTLFDVTNPLQRLAAPGDFTGRLRDGSIRPLNSYGIFRIDMMDARRQAVRVRPGVSVALSIPIPRPLVKNAPKQAGYYVFDPADGMWIESGRFELSPTRPAYVSRIGRLVYGDGGAGNVDVPK